jgi:hypothetical protein
MKLSLFSALVLAGWLAMSAPAFSQAAGGTDDATADSAEPRLRIETGGHTKTIFAISADAASRFVLTASADQTARLWDLKTKSLLQTYRPASTKGRREGELYAAAISPDANTIVFGGRTGPLWSTDRSYGFYAYSRHSSQAARWFWGLKGSVQHLAFSPDGQYLAVSTTNGARVYSVSNWAYWDFPNGLWVDVASKARNRVVVAAADSVDLYQYDQTQDKWTSVAGVDRTHAQVTFSPDGKRLLVKSTAKTGESILDVYLGDQLDQPVSLETGKYQVDRAVFSKQGSAVFGSLVGGRIALWASDGSDDEPEIWNLVEGAESHETPIHDLAALSDGRLLYTSGRSGEWGVVRANKEEYVVDRALPNIIDPSVNGAMGLAFDGSEVLYGDDDGKVLFSVRKRAASDQGVLDKSTGPAPISKGSQAGSLILPGPGNRFPMINGVQLRTLKQNPPVTCYAVLPDAIYLATEQTLYAYHVDGTPAWPEPISITYLPALIRRSGDGRYLVVAGRDGAFHWLSAATGKLVFTVFVSPDWRWVMWTPAGYYDASAGGEDLIGWQVNRDGKGPLADYYGGSRFRSRYYRPDLFPAILKTGDEVAALRSLATPTSSPTAAGPQTRSIDAVLPPVVTILSPDRDVSVSSTTVTVRYAVSSQNEPVTNVAVKIDGRPIPVARALTPADSTVQVEIPQHDCEISLIAENKFGAGDPAKVRVHWTGSTAQVAKPTLFVVSVGVSKYNNPALRLGLPAKDAGDLAAAFQAQQGVFYGNVRSQVLVDGQATRASVLHALHCVVQDTDGCALGQVHQGDFVVIFLAGHGAADDAKSYYFLAADADPTDLLSTAVPFSTITEMVSKIQAHTVLFVDTCHSGTLNQANLAAIADINAIANGLSDESVGAVVFTASTGSQYALEDPKWGNGAFTKALVEGLHGNAVDGGEITISTLERWVGKRVKNLTCGKQTPVCAKRVADFSIASGTPAAAPPAAQNCTPN